MVRDFSTQSPPTPYLLRLPPHIRDRTYRHLGVARFDGHPYAYHLSGREEPRRGRSDYDPPPARNFSGLLLSCRALYAEVAALLYSANRFVISYPHQGSLEPLRALSQTSLASLTSLKVVLNESSCHYYVESNEYPPIGCCGFRGAVFCAERHGSVHQHPLLKPVPGIDSATIKPAARAMLTEWHNTALHLSYHVNAARLALSLVCDIDPQHEDALEVARQAVAPFGLLSPLKDCHIRLCKTPNRPLQQLAEEAVLQAHHKTSLFCLEPAKVSSHWTSLPQELRHRILEYTDLIAPWKEVAWSREDHTYHLYRPPCFFYKGGCPPHIHRGCRLSQCNRADDADPASSLLLLHGCFCRRRHAAFSFTCNCWAPPTNLFLICRAWCRDAQFVFFSGNRFVVNDCYDSPPPDPAFSALSYHYPYERFAISEFLREAVPAHCVADLRFLELVFPPFMADGWPLERDALVQDWRAALIWARGVYNAPALTIRIVMSYPIGPQNGPHVLTREEGRRVINGYARIIGPFRSLARDDGLGAFYVRPAYPWRWTLDIIRRVKHGGRRWLTNAEQDLKNRYEGYVRGQGASLASRNTAEPRKSAWQHWEYDSE